MRLMIVLIVALLQASRIGFAQSQPDRIKADSKDFRLANPDYVMPDLSVIYEITYRSLAKGKCPNFNNHDPEVVRRAFFKAYSGTVLIPPQYSWHTAFLENINRASAGKAKLMLGSEADKENEVYDGDTLVITVNHGLLKIYFIILDPFGDRKNPPYECKISPMGS